MPTAWESAHSVSSGQLKKDQKDQGAAGGAKEEAKPPQQQQAAAEAVPQPSESVLKLTKASSSDAERWLSPWAASNGGVAADEQRLTVNQCALDETKGDTLCFASASEDGGDSIAVYSLAAGSITASFMHGEASEVTSLACDGDTIAAASRDKSIQVWSDVKDPRVIRQTAHLKGCEESIFALALRGDVLISGEGSSGVRGGKAGGVARVWALSKRAVTAVLPEHNGPIWSIALWSDKGGGGGGCGEPLHAISASSDATARVWRVGQARGAGAKAKLYSDATLKHPHQFVYSASVASSEGLAATGCGDGYVRLWALNTHACLRALHHGGGAVMSVRLHGGVLASGGQDRTVQLWSLGRADGLVEAGNEADGGRIATLTHGAAVRGLAISSATGTIVSAGGSDVNRLVVWRPS